MRQIARASYEDATALSGLLLWLMDMSPGQSRQRVAMSATAQAAGSSNDASARDQLIDQHHCCHDQ